jgi:phage terminase large subunit
LHPSILQIIPLAFHKKQKAAISLLKDRTKKYYLLYGGSRSGKTALIIESLINMCMEYPGSKHLVARFSLANARKTIWNQTIIPMVKAYVSQGLCTINKTQLIIEFSNGSIIQLGGLQPDQIDGVLGSEFATIFVNEANENRWSCIELLFSRLNDISVNSRGNQIHCRFIADLNPTSLSSWDYKFFHLKQNPDTGKRHEEHKQICFMRINPQDNEKNLAKGYLKTLKGFSPAKRKRFFEGEYGNYAGLIYDLKPEQRSVDFSLNNFDTTICGLDFGHRHPNVFSIIKTDGERWVVWDEHYQKGLTSTNVRRVAQELNEKYHFDYMFCDSSRSEIIAELQEDGLPAEAAIKGKGSVFSGVMYCKGLMDSGNLWINTSQAVMHGAECDSYRWDEMARERGEEKPIKEDDDCMDAMRYGIYSYVQRFGLNAKSEDLYEFHKQL